MTNKELLKLAVEIAEMEEEFALIDEDFEIVVGVIYSILVKFGNYRAKNGVRYYSDGTTKEEK